ncbi:hypothetical protein [Streptomyces sp. NRRL S-813]|uniref:hypothetical protein n=1 Tax=Streptomyces sp. NRRL S-813 TaxID=1463919 RepID=UPI0004BFBE6E|nr:hypothetical protein [Streptomyces sp. NRRL S-813]
MTAEKPRRRPQPRYVNRRALALLFFSFRGLIPACVIADALEEKARREGRPLPPLDGRRP